METTEECEIFKIAKQLKEIGNIECEIFNSKLFMEIPDRWYEKPHFRCENGHVSTFILRCDDGGFRDRCLDCKSPTTITYPEDEDGPMPPNHVIIQRITNK